MHYLRPCNPTGLSPHVRAGLSPRVRGVAVERPGLPGAVGFIPACAGSGTPRSSPMHAGTVYPRVCGEWVRSVLALSVTYGLSPRVRGGGTAQPRRVNDLGFIPACAGRSEHYYGHRPRDTVYPRVCGEE